MMVMKALATICKPQAVKTVEYKMSHPTQPSVTIRTQNQGPQEH